MPLPPRSQPVLSLAQRQREAAKLLLRLDEMLKTTAELGTRARERVSVGGFGRYRRFTKRVRDFFALASVTEEKIFAEPELAESPMATALDRLHARMVVVFVERSAAFFDLYVRVKHLPIGTHEMCGVELRGLLAIRQFLDDPRYEGERGRALQAEADRIARMMRIVMDRVPPLEDFGHEPSIGPKGQSKRPLKAPPRPPPPPPPPPPDPEPDPDPLPTAWVKPLVLDPDPEPETEPEDEDAPFELRTWYDKDDDEDEGGG